MKAPIKAPVAGVAMGLITEGDKFAVLSDIAGLEDHFGDMDYNLYLVRSGEVKIMDCVDASHRLHHIATFGRGEFFGGLAFLDHRPRGNSAVVSVDCELYVLSSEKFNTLAEDHKRIAFVLLSQLARILAIRLRHTDQELTILREN